MAVLTPQQARDKYNKYKAAKEYAQSRGYNLTAKGARIITSTDVTANELFNSSEEFVSEKLEGTATGEKLSAEIENKATISYNMGAAVRSNMPFSVDGKKFNPESEVLNPRVYDTKEEAIRGEALIKKTREYNELYPERKEKFFQETERIKSQGLESAPKYNQSEFYSIKGQQGAIKRGSVGLFQAEQDLINTLTFGAVGRQNKFTATTSNEKVNLFLESKANNPALTAAEATLIWRIGGAVKVGSLALTGRGSAAVATKVVASSTIKKIGVATLRSASHFPAAVSNVLAVGAMTKTAVLTKTLTQDEARDLRNPNTRTIYSEVLQQQAGEISQTNIFNRAAYGITTLGLPENVGKITKGLGFEGESRKEQFTRLLSERDLTTTETTALIKLRKAGGVSEVTSILAAGVSGEKAGRAAQKIVFQNTAPTSAKMAFVQGAAAIAPAGFIEGSTGEFTQQVAREENINLQRIVAVGGIGTITAGAFGGTMVAAQTASKEGLRGGTELLGNVLDPFEFPADKLTDLGGGLSRGFRGVPTNAFSFGGIIPSSSSSNTFSQSANAQSPALSSTLAQSQSNQQSFISSLSQSQSSAETITKNLDNPLTQTPTQSQTPTNTNPFAFTQSQSLTMTQSIVNTPAQSQSQVNTQQNTLVNVNSITQSNVPVINFRFPAAPPPSPFGGGGSGLSFSKPKGSRRQSFAIEPLVFSRLRGTAKKGKRLGFQT